MPPSTLPQPPGRLGGDPRTLRLVRAYESLRPESLGALLDAYCEDARFKDPFNEVQGRAAIEHIFRHMFEALEAPRFAVLDAITQGDDAFLTWDFTFRMRKGGDSLRIHGATHLRFGPDGRVTLHRDYWDAAEELYAQLPIIGVLMRWLQRRLRTPAPAFRA